MKLSRLVVVGCAMVALSTCVSEEIAVDSFVIATGQHFTTSAPVVTWQHDEGYDGHRETCWFRDDVLPIKPAPGCNTRRRYSARRARGEKAAKAVAESGWTLDLLRERVDQIVLHYDACGCSKKCFEVLHDRRGLSCHFLLDVDGTIYQTLDLTARGRHATIANDRSIGVEIANIGAYGQRSALDRWYVRTPAGDVKMRFPEELGDPGLRTPGFVARPARSNLIRGRVNGHDLMQYDFTDAQYASLAKLVRTLAGVFPKIRLAVPRDAAGRVREGMLPRAEFDAFTGVLGHSHVQKNKTDPGPAFDWERLLREAAHRP
ncbi:MAG: negative regulator of beta-lactamase [Planctomycetes bacterium]|nr:negative regulator of beta-lactamase [Planctomycetota bacterium]